jgi:hypothetical protein
MWDCLTGHRKIGDEISREGARLPIRHAGVQHADGQVVRGDKSLTDADFSAPQFRA